jgi:hypothetical protein
MSPSQQLTIEQAISQAEKAAGQGNIAVARQTVNNWRHNDAAFAARFNAERQDLWSTHREKLRSLVAQAVDVLAEDMAAKLEPKLRQSVAIHVLKAVGLYGQDMKPSGAIDSVQVERNWQANDDMLKLFEEVSA